MSRALSPTGPQEGPPQAPRSRAARLQRGGLAIAGLLWFFAGTALAIPGCIPSELVLRDPVVNWQRLGITRVAVVTIPATYAPAHAVQSLATPVATGDPALLSRESARAAELLRFALMQSAFDVGRPGPGTARLEIAVTRVSLGRVTADAPGDVDLPPGRPLTLDPNPQSAGTPGSPRSVRPGDIAASAVLAVRLVEAGQTRPIWSKVARGHVDYRPPQSLFGAGPDRLDARTAELLRGIAVRRALLQVVRELLPSYRYQDVE